MSRRLAHKLFLIGWPLVVVAAGVAGAPGLAGCGVALLVLAGAIAIPGSIAVILNDNADRQDEKQRGMSEAHRSVREKGRTAAWGYMISCILVALLVWSDYRVLLWLLVPYTIALVIALPLYVVVGIIRRWRRSNN